MNKKNTDESNLKRLESLKRQADEFKQKKNQIRSDLIKDSTLIKNNKVIFDDEDEINIDDDDELKTPQQKLVKLISDKSENKTFEANKKEGNFVEIDSNIKEIFCSKDVFQFQFNNMDENISDDDMSNKSDDDDVEINLNVEKTEDSLNNKQPISIVSKFLPDFSRDEQIREALVYFHCTKTEDELKLDWPARRDVLVQEYKKKHKRMIRIKKNSKKDFKLPNKNNNKK